MTSVLIIYATREGQTEKVASRIKDHLQSMGLQVSLLNAADSQAVIPGLAGIDLLVCGASMHAGGLEPELVNFVNRFADDIKDKPRSFFLVLLSAATHDPELRQQWLGDAREKMREQLTISFPDTEMIAGALTYSRYSWPLKLVMKRIAKLAGEDTDLSKDYEYTDWNQVKRYSERLLTMIGKPQV